MLLSREEIEEAVGRNYLGISEFHPNGLSPASYDARVGNRGFSSSSKEKIRIDEKGTFIIRAGDFAVITSLEGFKLPLDIAGLIGIRSKYARKGIVLLTGPQIDPGFCGVLVIGLFNSSPRDVVLAHGEPLLTISFVKLHQPAKRGYTGPYQDQDDIPAADLQWLVETEGMSIALITQKLGELASSVKAMEASIEDWKHTVDDWKRTVDRSIDRLQWLVGLAIGFLSLVVVLSRVL